MASRSCVIAASWDSTPNGSWPTRPRPRGCWPMPGAERFRRLPKVELHLHAAGSVRPVTIREFVAADGLAPALGERYTTAGPGEGLPASLPRFAAWDTPVTTPQGFARVVTELIEDLSADGVVYAEVRLRPPTEDDGLWHAMMESAIQTARAVTAPVVEFIAVML